jgi:hypothetical protein
MMLPASLSINNQTITPTNHMKKLILSVILLCSIFTLRAQTNYSGKWELDTIKSDFGHLPIWAGSYSLEVRQGSNDINIKYFDHDNRNEEHTFSQMVGWDWKDYVTTTYSGKKRTCSVQMKQPNSFVMNIHTETNDGQAYNTMTENWSISPDGMTLTVVRSVEQSVDGFKYTLKMVYEKRNN